MADNEREIETMNFTVGLRGYDRDEVDAYLSKLAEEMRELRKGAEGAPTPVAEPAAPPKATETPTDLYKRVGEETSKILLAAEEAGKEIREKASRDAAEVMADARRKAQEVARISGEQRTAADEELRKLQQARDVLATQLEDVGRRLQETIGRLKTPIEGQVEPTAATKTEARPQPTPTGTVVEKKPEEPKPPEDKSQEVTRPEPGGVQDAPSPSAAPEPEVADSESRDTAQRVVPPSAEARERPAESPAKAQAPSPPAKAEAPSFSQAAPALEPKDARFKEAQQRPESRSNAAEAEAEATIESLLEEIRRDREHGKREVAAALDQITGKATTKTQAPLEAPVETPPAGKAAAAPASSTAAVDVQKSRDSALEDVKEGASRRLKRLLQEDQNLLLDRLRTHKGKGSFDESISPPAEQLDRFRSGMGDPLSEAFRVGRRTAGVEAGDPSRAVGDLIGKQLVNPLRRDLGRIVDAGLAAGDTSRAIAERASDVFRVWKGVRTELLGEGLVYSAFHQGLIDGWRSQDQTNKKWVFSAGEGDCPRGICQTNADAGSVGLSDPFPSGHLAPPAHGGCTCTLSEG